MSEVPDVRIPKGTLDKIAGACHEFKKDEAGTGISDYGAILAVLMVLGGMAAGLWLFSTSSSKGNSSEPSTTFVIGPVPVQDGQNQSPPSRAKGESCEACGMG